MNDHTLSNPRAGASAAGADFDYQAWLAWIDNNLSRESSARALARAIVDCDQSDRLEFLEAAYDFFFPRFPVVLMGSVMDEATFWAERSSRGQRKAYLLACFNSISCEDQASFLKHVQHRGAA